MIGNLLAPELKELIQRRDFTRLREILCDFPAADLAEIFVDLNPDDEAVLLRILPHQRAAEIFEYLPLEDQEETLKALGKEEVAKILNEIAPDDRTALLEELPSAATQNLKGRPTVVLPASNAEAKPVFPIPGWSQRG